MRIGLQIPSFSWPGGPERVGARLGEIASTADDAGFASLWVMDHFFQIPMVGPAEREMLEGGPAPRGDREDGPRHPAARAPVFGKEIIPALAEL